MQSQLSSPTRAVLLVAGTTCVGLAVAGSVLPLLPTTPFLLLAAACYARGSERLHRAILDNPVFGPTIRAYREDRSIPRSAKRKAFVLIPIAFALSIAMVDMTALRLLLVAVAVGLLTFLHRLPTTDG